MCSSSPPTALPRRAPCSCPLCNLKWFALKSKVTPLAEEYRKSLKNVTEEPTLCGSRGCLGGCLLHLDPHCKVHSHLAHVGRRLFNPNILVDPMEIIRADEVLHGQSVSWRCGVFVL
eukprot:1659510-Amphidinium_carterae.1